jgi:predicted RNA-binding protein YlqC (UPF0109 family)
MRDLVSLICKGLGIQENELGIEESGAEGGRKTLTLRMPYASLQVLDGREHRTARALRLVLSAAAAVKNEHLNLVAKAQD